MNTPGTTNSGATVSANREAVVAVAPAKVNLTLEVVGKQTDGFHAIETLMVAVDLFDTLEFRKAERELTLTCEKPGIPTDERNLVWKAATALRQASGTMHGATIHLTKRIPHEAGLGGGSSDAATTLLALNELWQLKLTIIELSQIAAEIGSDVPFFIVGGAAWCTGRGEIVEPETVGQQLNLAIVKLASVGLSTKEVYRRVVVPAQPCEGIPARVALRAGDTKALGRALMNRLQAPAFAVAPAVDSLVRELAALRPLGCQLSGSGSAVFALCHDAREATRIATAIRQSPSFVSTSLEVYVCRSWHAAASPSEDRHLS